MYQNSEVDRIGVELLKMAGKQLASEAYSKGFANGMLTGCVLCAGALIGGLWLLGSRDKENLEEEEEI